MKCLHFLRHHVLNSTVMDHICIETRTAVRKKAEMRTISPRKASILEILAAILSYLVVDKFPFCPLIGLKLN